MTLASGISRQLGPLRRAVLNATRRAGGLPDLPETHIEVLRTLSTEPGLTTTEIAQRLRLARPTVSNLISAMVKADLVTSRRAGEDRRIVTVYCTERAEGLLQRYDAVSEDVITRALGTLTAAERAALAEAIPVLDRVVDLLQD